MRVKLAFPHFAKGLSNIDINIVRSPCVDWSIGYESINQNNVDCISISRDGY